VSWTKLITQGNGTTTPSGKKWLAMGDSITFGQNLPSADYATKSYLAVANQKLNMTIKNVAYSGAAMTKRDSLDNYSFIELSKGVYNTLPLNFNDYDVLTVAYGTNDYGFNSGTGVPIGADVNSIDEATFYGAMNVGIQNILSGKTTSNPKLKIAFILPIFRSSADTATPPINANGHSLQDYRNAIIAVCNKWKIPYIDAYNGLGMNSLNHSIYMNDGLHPIEAGHKRYGEFLAGQMISLGLN
jgi:lysophospholipase L1-like esterase